ncbi:14 kDa phosphohistidine phosphatase-like, partial [Centruroides sculpturatus]|uniref:14 kDa phosphohistidine phosphatase-like n=1 Tax=Centruroides sculpturatus TaxID=218467 RepID=UPI000C6DC74F
YIKLFEGDILDDVEPKITTLGLKCECVGGGRIRHKSEEKKIDVYGYSQGYGKADHNITCEILKRKYPDYKITITNEGY